MISLYGWRDVPILFTGLRPGEKLTEELWSQGEDTGCVSSSFACTVDELFQAVNNLCLDDEGVTAYSYIMSNKEKLLEKARRSPNGLRFRDDL
jgi:FlaA1/EpsC-like NDP-sugar epimerase